MWYKVRRLCVTRHKRCKMPPQMNVPRRPNVARRTTTNGDVLDARHERTMVITSFRIPSGADSVLKGRIRRTVRRADVRLEGICEPERQSVEDHNEVDHIQPPYKKKVLFGEAKPFAMAFAMNSAVRMAVKTCSAT